MSAIIEMFTRQIVPWLTPINLVLFLMLIATWFIIKRAQHGGKFDFGNLLRDEEGKESALRLAAIGSFAISSWVIMQLTVTASITETYYGIYLLTWSGSVVLAKAIEVWKGKPS